MFFCEQKNQKTSFIEVRFADISSIRIPMNDSLFAPADFFVRRAADGC